MSHPLEMFDQVRIINLVERADRRQEMSKQLELLGGPTRTTRFFEARRPEYQGEFPSIGARGCFESQLTVLREARDKNCETLLLMEDDLDFTRGGLARIDRILEQLRTKDWSFFYGAHVLNNGDRHGLIQLAPQEPVMTASCVGFRGRVIPELVEFLEAMLQRPAGSPNYGPMHVDGAYTVFRQLNPHHSTYAAFPALGRQRSSPSDISPTKMILDRWAGTQTFAALLRKGYNWVKRQ